MADNEQPAAVAQPAAATTAAAAPSAEQQQSATATSAAPSTTTTTLSSTSTTAPPAKSAPTSSDFEPPAACIRRLLKQTLPKSTNISKDSLSALSRASGIFILYLTACANDVAREGRRTTIVAKDVIGALKELEFEEFIPAMEKFLEGHRREERSKKEERERAKSLVGVGERRDSGGKFVEKKKDEGGNGEGNKVDGDKGDEKIAAETTATAAVVEKTSVDATTAAATTATTAEKHSREEKPEGETPAKKQKLEEGGE